MRWNRWLPKSGAPIFLIAIWGLLATVGTALSIRYANAPGEGARPAHVVPAKGRSQLRVYLHPSCPCSRATVAELSRLLTQIQGKVDATIFLFGPDHAPDSWYQTELAKSLVGLPGCVIVRDEGGRQAIQSDVRTSGQVVLYDARGNLVFAGGITSGRGHEGPNLGSDAIREFVLEGRREIARTPVFGCALGVDL